MAYKYFLAGSPIYFESPNQTFIREFDTNIDLEFTVASDYYTIQEEATFASGSLSNVGVRITTATDPATNEKLGDDFKTILTNSTHAALTLGQKFYFDTNYWIVYNSSSLKSLVNSAIVRRCNNVLRWIDDNGMLHTEPCAIPPEIRQSNDTSGTINPVTPGGFIYAYAQANSVSRKIKANQRFLFGNADNWIVYKVIGNGVRNFLNNQTSNNDSCQLLELILERNFLNEDTDDLVNGIANYHSSSYSLSVIPTSITGNIGDTFQVTPTLTRNGDPITKPISYSTSASPIATVSGSGLVTLITNGSCIITGCMTNNTSASAVIPVTVSASAVSNYEIRVSPDSDYILEGETKTYDVKLYLDGVVQADTFTFIINDANVPLDKYTLASPNGNTFVLTNNAYYLDYPLVISCTSGTHNRLLSISLRGAW